MDFENIFQQYINNNGFNEEKHQRFVLKADIVKIFDWSSFSILSK